MTLATADPPHPTIRPCLRCPVTVSPAFALGPGFPAAGPASMSPEHPSTLVLPTHQRIPSRPLPQSRGRLAPCLLV